MKLRRIGRRRLIGTTLALSALAAVPAFAGPGWTPSQDLSALGAVPSNAKVAVDGAGNATAIWTEAGGTDTTVVTATRPVGSTTWTSPETLATTPNLVDPVPALSANDAGALVAVWLRSDGVDAVVEARSKTSFGSSWSASHDLSTSVTDLVPANPVDEGEAQGPNVAVSADGTAVATWERFDAANSIIQASRLTAGIWSSAADLSATGRDSFSSQVGVDGNGNATAIWIDFDGAVGVTHTADLSKASSSWTASTPISGTADTAFPQVAVNATGAAIAVWVNFNFPNTVESASRPAGGSWSNPEPLTSNDSDATTPVVAIDAAGTATAAWVKDVNGTTRIQVGRRIVGVWSATDTLSPDTDNADGPRIAVTPSGEATVVWVTASGLIQSAHRTSAGPSWSPPTDRSAALAQADRPAIAVNDSGNAAAIWTTSTGDTRTQAALFDVTAPAAGTITVPASGQAGTLVPMSATPPTDNWSGAGETTWNFGDGATAVGATASHIYTSGGQFTVTVTQTDGVGNATTQTRTVSISAPVVVTPLVVTPPVVTPPAAKLTITNVAGSCLKRPKKVCQARVAFKLDAAAKVTLTIRRNGKVIGTITRSGRVGPQVVMLPARVGGKAITAGTYKIAISAVSTTAGTATGSAKVTVK
jgi:PKD domain